MRYFIQKRSGRVEVTKAQFERAVAWCERNNHPHRVGVRGSVGFTTLYEIKA